MVFVRSLSLCSIDNFSFYLQILLIVLWSCGAAADAKGQDSSSGGVSSHSCIHDQIIEQRKRPGRKVYSVTPQVYHEEPSSARKGRALLSLVSEDANQQQPIRIYLNYDAVGLSFDRDCQTVGDIVKVVHFKYI